MTLRPSAFSWHVTPILLAALAMGGPVRAETLNQAFEQALQVDGKLKASERQIGAAQSAVDAAQGLSLPSFAVDAAYNHWSEAPAVQATVPMLGTLQMPVMEVNGGVYRAGVSVPLYTSGALSRNTQAAEATLGAARSDTERTRQDLKLQVAEAYINVLRARSLLALAESGVQTLASHLKDVNAYLDKGLVARNDQLAAQAASDNARQDRIRARTAVQIAESAYNRLLGRPLTQPVAIDEITLTPADLATPDPGRTRSEVTALIRQTEALRAQSEAARAQGGPQVVLSGGFNQMDNRYLAKEGLWNVAVGLHWSIFDGGVHRSQADALAARADAVAAQRADAETQVALQQHADRLLVDEAAARTEAAQSAVTQADENLRVARDRYQSGVGTNTEVLDAETLRLKSHNNLSNARYDHALAVQRLKRAFDAL
ncbi:TolC family protein [Ideonella sp. B7]|uniref:TolC family protein n=1 Tax=Ideonella benzenivorans TaxID=2831643 RepID=UPI001CECC22F|nr:TolC family protein [Ideonella benzenivorans]MCA6215055.1 TolC family protein [Ideonella benzenivorans]